MLPPPLELAVLALAAFRLWRLLAVDEILTPLRARLIGMKPGAAEQWTFRRPRLALFLSCAWCFGFWVAASLYLAWRLTPTVATYAAVPLALSALVGFLARLDD